jgi:hypothetical protein
MGAVKMSTEDFEKQFGHVVYGNWVTTSEIVDNFLMACKFKPIRVIFDDPATICVWKDGTKTVVVASEDEKFVPEFGVAMCIVKKLYGNRSEFLRLIDRAYVVPPKQPKKKKK